MPGPAGIIGWHHPRVPSRPWAWVSAGWNGRLKKLHIFLRVLIGIKIRIFFDIAVKAPAQAGLVFDAGGFSLQFRHSVFRFSLQFFSIFSSPDKFFSGMSKIRHIFSNRRSSLFISFRANFVDGLWVHASEFHFFPPKEMRGKSL